MICPSCGHEIDDDAAFCTECGARIDQPAAPEPDEPAPAKKRPLSVAQKAAIAGLVVALLAGGGGAGYYFGAYVPGQRRAAAQKLADERAHVNVRVKIAVSADGWDTATGASRLPVHVTGTSADGDVDEVQYVASDGTGIVLIPGTYDIVVAASPIAADGSLFDVPSQRASLTVGADTDVDPDSPDVPATPDEVAPLPDTDYDSTGDVAVTLKPADMTTVTDDQIAEAKRYASQDPQAAAGSADQLASSATAKRDDAVAQKKAAEEEAARKKAAEEAAAKKQQAMGDLVSRALSTNYDDGTRSDGIDSTSFKFDRKQTSNGVGPFLDHRDGFWTVKIYSGDEATSRAVALYAFKQGVGSSLLHKENWPSIDADGQGIAVVGIYGSKDEAAAGTKELEAAGIPYDKVIFTGPRSGTSGRV